jgi:anaerobic selenocysteine-containing dehydrogenase
MSWEDTLDDLAGIIGTVRDHSGSDALGLYLATGLAYDSAGQVACGLTMAALGSSSFYTAATVDNAPVLVAAEQVTGNAMMNPVWEPHRHGLLVILGSNPVVSHGYGTTLADPVRRLREHRDGGGRVVVIDPRRTETAAQADVHLAARPGSDVILLAALAGQLLADGADAVELADHCPADQVDALRRGLEPFTIDSAALATGLPKESVEELLAEIRASRGRLAMFCGTGTTMARDGILVEWLRWVLLILTGSLDVEGGMRFNRGVVNIQRPPRAIPALRSGPSTRPELVRVAGQIPAVAMVDEIESGRLRVLFVAGGNPLSAFPEPDRLRSALTLLDALIVLDVAAGEMTELATHVLPVTAQLERADLTLAEQVSFRSGMQYTDAVVTSVGQRRPVWWILASVLGRLGLELFPGSDPDQLDDRGILAGLLAHGPLDATEVLAAGAHGVELPATYGWVREMFLPGGVWQLAPRVFLDRLAGHLGPEPGLVLVPRRENGWSNSVLAAGDGSEPVAHLHPEDAAAAGLGDGGWAAIRSAHGSMVVVVGFDPGLRRGTVSVTHGHRGASPGLVVSGTRDVDPLTAMPWASGLPVSILPLRG